MQIIQLIDNNILELDSLLNDSNLNKEDKFELALIISKIDKTNNTLEISDECFNTIMEILYSINNLPLIQTFLKQDRKNIIKPITI